MGKRITVDTVDRPQSMMSTIITGSGLDSKGRRVTFGSDWRPMRDLAQAVEEYGTVEVEVEPWMILSVGPKPPKMVEPSDV